MNSQLQKKDSTKVPEPTLRRLPWYLSNVKLLRKRGERFVSSTQISKEINIDASQIAKDLSYVNISGRTRVGYEIDTLIAVLEDFLGFTNIHKAFLFVMDFMGEVGNKKRLAVFQNSRVGFHEDNRFPILLSMPKLPIVLCIIHPYCYDLHYLISLKFKRLNITARCAYNEVF